MGAGDFIGRALIRRSILRWIVLLALVGTGVYHPHPLMPFAVPVSVAASARADFDLCSGSGKSTDQGDRDEKAGGHCCHCLACAHHVLSYPPQNAGVVIQFPHFVVRARVVSVTDSLQGGLILRVSARPRAPPVSV